VFVFIATARLTAFRQIQLRGPDITHQSCRGIETCTRPLW